MEHQPCSCLDGKAGLVQGLPVTTGGPGIDAVRNKQIQGERSTIYRQRTCQLQGLHEVLVPQTTEECGRNITKEAWVQLIADCQQRGNIPPSDQEELAEASLLALRKDRNNAAALLLC